MQWNLTQDTIIRFYLIAAAVLGLSSQKALYGSLSLKYETYLESWDSQWNKAMTGLPPTPPASPTTYDGVLLDIAFASYTFPGLNGLQFSNTTSDVDDVIHYVHSQNGKVKISYGGASYAGPNYFISQTDGWPNNIPALVSGVQSVVQTYGFDGVDFDIEDALPSGTTSQEFADQLFSFLTQMREALPESIISLTIPGQGWGTYWQILAKQVANASTVNYINFMEYDIWVGASSYPAQIQADIITYTSPTNTSPAPNNAQGWGIPVSIVQLGLMPGNDDTGQFLSVSDAEELTEFAIGKNLVGVMTWDLNRDAGTDPVPSLGGASPYAYSNAIRSIIDSVTSVQLTSSSDTGLMLTKPRGFVRHAPPLHGAQREHHHKKHCKHHHKWH